MAGSCPCFFQGSKPWMVLVFPIIAVYATYSQGLGFVLITITVSAILVFGSKSSTQKPVPVEVSEVKEVASTVEDELSPKDKVAEKPLVKPGEDSTKDFKGLVPAQDEFLIRSRSSYSESESMDRYSLTEDEDDGCSDIEWPYNMEQRINYSDGSISDEESLIEIAIPSGQFVSSPEKDRKCCNKLYGADFEQESIFLKDADLDFLAADSEMMNEEDNLIEIDIYMGSIKCSSFGI